MTKIIYCIYLKKYAEGLKYPCYPGKLGEYIYKNISQEAWNKWQNVQTILINENKLNMLCAKDRSIIEKKMKKFLCLKPL